MTAIEARDPVRCAQQGVRNQPNYNRSKARGCAGVGGLLTRMAVPGFTTDRDILFAA
jgi:hypothetical protein